MKTLNTIEIALKEHGIRQSDIANSIGYGINTVNNNVQRKAHTQVVQDVIASILEIDPETLWGLDYAPRAKKALRQIGFIARTRKYQITRMDRPGDWMRRLRYERKIPLDALEDATGIHKSTLSRYENNKRRMAGKTIERIAMGLGVDPNWIEFGDEAGMKVILTEDAGTVEKHSEPSYPANPKSQEKSVLNQAAMTA